ncbi:hypothetical protein Bpfe_031085 [Biomphalaria pfeifferi]|uniref:Uncharacterized protein n=1 Tax=Biomphalaria pfeifferi TaxID=112525 RepID=A0AAD8EU65_BIOPF|nr:hypothetical protein Bpfe_031085 [Biomphalaria pfeifferi]
MVELFEEADALRARAEGAAPARSSLPVVRNPLVELPAFKRLQALDPKSRAVLRALLLELREQARSRGDDLWRRNKPWSGVYWRVVSVYAGHTARLLRDQ